MRKNPCVQTCPDRKVRCRETCPKWFLYNTEKQEEYKRRQLEFMMNDYFMEASARVKKARKIK